MFNLYADRIFLEQQNKFNSYYEQVLRPKLEQSDKIRRRYLGIFFILLLMATVFYPLMIYAILTMSTDGLVGLGSILGASGFVILTLRGPIYFYKKKVKNNIMSDFANFFGTFSYENGKYLPDNLLIKSELFKNYNTHSGDDYFYGTYKDVGIMISEEKLQKITVSYETSTNIDGYTTKKQNTRKKTIFQGICILLTMNKNFKGRTVVLKDKGLFNVFKHISGLQRVKLEDIRFEELFEVYSSDQIEARYLLTAAFMERMLKLSELYGGKSIQFSFKDNQLLLAIPTKKDMFEACSFFRSNVNKKKIDKVFEQFYTVFSVVDILKLNQRTGM